MTPVDRNSNLLFLLSLTPLAAAGCPGDDSGTSGAGTGTASTGGTTGSATSPATDGGTMANDGSGTGAGTSAGTTNATTAATTDATTAATTAATGDTGDSSGTSGGLDCSAIPLPKVGMIGETCQDYTNLINDCDYMGAFPQDCVDLYEAYCQYYIESYEMNYGKACGAAVDEYLACLSDLSCEEFGDATPDCPEEGAAVEMECGMKATLDPRARLRHR